MIVFSIFYTKLSSKQLSYHCCWVLLCYLAEVFIGKLKDFSKISGFHRIQSWFLREELNLAKILILLQVSDIGLGLFMQDGNKTCDYKIHVAVLITFHKNVIIHSKRLLLEVLSDFT